MWRGVLRWVGKVVGFAIVLLVLDWLSLLPDRQFYVLLGVAFFLLVGITDQLDEIDKKLTTLAKKLNVDLEEKPREEKKIILAE